MRFILTHSRSFEEAREAKRLIETEAKKLKLKSKADLATWAINQIKDSVLGYGPEDALKKGFLDFTVWLQETAESMIKASFEGKDLYACISEVKLSLNRSYKAYFAKFEHVTMLISASNKEVALEYALERFTSSGRHPGVKLSDLKIEDAPNFIDEAHYKAGLALLGWHDTERGYGLLIPIFEALKQEAHDAGFWSIEKYLSSKVSHDN